MRAEETVEAEQGGTRGFIAGIGHQKPSQELSEMSLIGLVTGSTPLSVTINNTITITITMFLEPGFEHKLYIYFFVT